MKEKITKFLELNGWEYLGMEDYISYGKDGYLGVDFDDNEIVLIGDVGDILHLPINYYALVGALIEYRQLSFNYASVK